MSSRIRNTKHHAKARRCRYRTAQERLARDRRQAQQAAQALQQTLEDLGLPEDLVTEIAGRLRGQQKLLDKMVGMMCPPLFGCHTNTGLCRVWGWGRTMVLLRLHMQLLRKRHVYRFLQHFSRTLILDSRVLRDQ